MSADCPDCRKRVASLWALAADEELPDDELPPEWEQRCSRHVFIDSVAEAICNAQGDRTWQSLHSEWGDGGFKRDQYRRMAEAAIEAITVSVGVESNQETQK